MGGKEKFTRLTDCRRVTVNLWEGYISDTESKRPPLPRYKLIHFGYIRIKKNGIVGLTHLGRFRAMALDTAVRVINVKKLPRSVKNAFFGLCVEEIRPPLHSLGTGSFWHPAGPKRYP